MGSKFLDFQSANFDFQTGGSRVKILFMQLLHNQRVDFSGSSYDDSCLILIFWFPVKLSGNEVKSGNWIAKVPPILNMLVIGGAITIQFSRLTWNFNGWWDTVFWIIAAFQIFFHFRSIFRPAKKKFADWRNETWRCRWSYKTQHEKYSDYEWQWSRFRPKRRYSALVH